jgi:hypothetical protein
MWDITKEEERLLPGGEPAICSLETFSGEYEMTQQGKRGGKYNRVIHGLNHGDREAEVVRWDMWAWMLSLVGWDHEGMQVTRGKVIEPVMPETGGESWFKGGKRATLFSYTRDSEGVSEAKGSADGVWNVSLHRHIKLYECMREAICTDSIIEALRGEMVKSFLLIMVKGIQWDLLLGDPGFDLSKQWSEITTLDTRLCGNWSSREDSMTGQIRGQALIKPSKRSTEKEIATADALVIGQLEAGPMLENARNGRGFDSVRDVWVCNLIVEKLEDEHKRGVREGLEEQFLPPIWTRGRPGLTLVQEQLQGSKSHFLRPDKWVGLGLFVYGKDRRGGEPRLRDGRGLGVVIEAREIGDSGRLNILGFCQELRQYHWVLQGDQRGGGKKVRVEYFGGAA